MMSSPEEKYQDDFWILAWNMYWAARAILEKKEKTDGENLLEKACDEFLKLDLDRNGH